MDFEVPKSISALMLLWTVHAQRPAGGLWWIVALPEGPAASLTGFFQRPPAACTSIEMRRAYGLRAISATKSEMLKYQTLTSVTTAPSWRESLTRDDNDRRLTGEDSSHSDPEGDISISEMAPDEKDLKLLRKWLIGEEDGIESWLTLEKPPVEMSRSESREGDADGMRDRIAELERENADLRRDMGKMVEGVPEDSALIQSGEMESWEKGAGPDRQERAPRDLISDGSASESELAERFYEELREKEAEFRSREQELRSRLEQLEKELKEKETESRLTAEELELARMGSPEVQAKLEEKFQELRRKEQMIERMQEEFNDINAELKQKNEELRKLQELLDYKEREFSQREEDLLYREKMLEEERRRFEEARKEASGLDELEMKKRLEALKEEIQTREERLRNRENYLNSKEEELRRREQGIIEEEIEAREEERALEYREAKVKTGNRRLDDLLLGGIPFGTNILIHGPPFTGKEVMIGQFIAEGLTKGIPSIWVITDKTPHDIREEMRPILSGYEEYEKLGLVRYVDSYSMSMGETADDDFTVYIDDPTDHDKIMKAVEEIAKEFLQEHDYYRLGFRSLSTLIAYSDPNTAFRFLSPFCGRRKRDKAVAMYSMEKGMHGDREIQMLGSIMDGMVDFKVDQLKTYFAVQGVTDVQSRSYIRYTASKSSLSIGSFSLDHIR